MSQPSERAHKRYYDRPAVGFDQGGPSRAILDASYARARAEADAELADFAAKVDAHGRLVADKLTELYADVLPPGCYFAFDDGPLP